MRSSPSSLRLRVLLLIAVVVLPAVALNVYSAVQQRRWAAEERQRSALRLARGLAEDQAQLTERVQELLTALARVPAIRSADPETCPAVLADLLAHYPHYTSLSVGTPDGELVCRGLNPGERVRVDGLAIESAFRKALLRRDFTFGEYAIGTRTGRPVVPYALPVLRADGTVEAVITLTMDLVWLSRLGLDADLPFGAVLTLIDSEGTVLAHHPDPERWVGVRLPDDSPLRALGAELEEGVVDAPDLEGARRMYAFRQLPTDVAPPVLVAVGVGHDEVFAAANQLFTRNLLILVVLGTLALVAGWGVGTRLILEPFRSLLCATRRLAAGDLQARAAVRTREGELAELADAFNEMAEALERRTGETVHSLGALRRSEERYRSLVEATSAIVWSASDTGEFVQDQPGWRAFTGQSFEEMRGRGWLDAVHPDDRESTLAAWRDASRERSFWQVEQRLRRHCSEYRHMVARAVPIIGEDGAIREWAGVHIDITVRKRAELERSALLLGEQEARAEAEAANRAKSDFLAVVSHELRTPLTSIISYSELMETDVGGALSERHREFVERIASSAWHLTSLVDQILEFTRLESGRIRVHSAPVDLASLARDVLVDFETMAATKQVALRRDVPATPVVLSTDSAKVRQILVNLLSNAVKFTDEGEVRLELAVEACSVRLSVHDQGPGISDAQLGHIWETFWQAEKPLTRRATGTGLGLAIVRRLAQMLGGEVDVQSTPGVGSTFSFSLPREPAGRQAGDLVSPARIG